MYVKFCEDCQLYWESLNDGHICNGTLVREQWSVSFAMSKWDFMEEKSKMRVWDVNCNTAYGSNPTFSAWWSYESFCKAPDHMIAKAVNLDEDEVFEDCYDGDPSYEAFNLLDYKAMQDRQNAINRRNEINEELAKIAKFYEEEEAFLLSSEREPA